MKDGAILLFINAFWVVAKEPHPIRLLVVVDNLSISIELTVCITFIISKT